MSQGKNTTTQVLTSAVTSVVTLAMTSAVAHQEVILFFQQQVMKGSGFFCFFFFSLSFCLRAATVAVCFSDLKHVLPISALSDTSLSIVQIKPFGPVRSQVVIVLCSKPQ